MDIKKHIPNTITLLNLLSGCIAVVCIMDGHFVEGALFMFLGIFFDFFDGLAARALSVQSELGLQLDSLADVVTSGVVPALVMYQLFLTDAVNLPETAQWETFSLQPLALLGLLIAPATVYRLAKFNLDEEQQNYFKGLPSPANAILVMSLPLMLHFQPSAWLENLILNKGFLFCFTLLSCFLLNAPIKLFALKFKTLSFKPNAVKYIFLLLTVVLLIVFKFMAIPLIILLYIVISLTVNQKSLIVNR